MALFGNARYFLTIKNIVFYCFVIFNMQIYFIFLFFNMHCFDIKAVIFFAMFERMRACVCFLLGSDS